MNVGIINYGVGNFGSVARALNALKITNTLINQPHELSEPDCLILPGAGSFSECANILHSNGWADAIRNQVINFEMPILGICLGMQLLADYSNEGKISSDAAQGSAGLGLLPGRVLHLSELGCNYRVPHVGWNSLEFREPRVNLFSDIASGADFYFVHSYALVPEDSKDILATTDYGVPITAAVGRGNIYGTQFHPEKSSHPGFKVLRNFVEYASC